MIVLSRFIISFLAIVDFSIAAVNLIIRLPMTDYMVNITIAGPAELGDIGSQTVPMMIVPGSHSVAANMNPLVTAGSPQWHRLIFTPSNQVLIEPTLTFSPTATHSIFSIGHMSRVVQVYGGVAVVKNLGTTNGEVVIGHEDAPRIFEASCEPDTVMEIPGPFRVFGSIGLSNVDGSTLNVSGISFNYIGGDSIATIPEPMDNYIRLRLAAHFDRIACNETLLEQLLPDMEFNISYGDARDGHPVYAGKIKLLPIDYIDTLTCTPKYTVARRGMVTLNPVLIPDANVLITPRLTKICETNIL
jgi:hypothetical protein